MNKAEHMQPGDNLVGSVEDSQIEAWKKQYGVKEIPYIEVKQEDTDDISVCYLKPAGRDVLAQVLSLYHNGKIVEAGEIAVINCWLAGDERLKSPKNLSQERTAVRLAQLAISVVALPEGYAGVK